MKVIAEVGSNWWTFEDCKNSIALAKNCGAWAVKFQAFNHKALYGVEGPESPWALTLDWLPRLAEKGKACGIEFMCTAFSPELAEAVNPYVNYHKVASSDLTHKRLLQKIASFGKPVFLSMGAHTMEDIRHAVQVLGEEKVTLLYCVSQYPARYINFDVFEDLKKVGVPLGFSDHSTDVLVIPKEAQVRGACVIEKHVNLVDAKDTPDSPHSLNVDELKAMCEVLSGKKPHRPSMGECDMTLMHNRRLIATRDIQAGEKLKEGENFGAYRSLVPDESGLSAWAIDEVNGKPVKQALKAGQAIGPQDYE